MTAKMESEGVITFSLSIFCCHKILEQEYLIKILSVSVGKMHAHGI